MMVFVFAVGCVLIMFCQALTACLSVSSFSWPSPPVKILGGDNLTRNK